MTGLETPKLGTDPTSGWNYYALHLTMAFILKEYFLVSNYQRCIKNVANFDEVKEREVAFFEKLKGPLPNREFILAGAKELSDWSKKMEKENYHEVYVNSFIGMWSSFEAGLENIIADFIFNDRYIAVCAKEKFKSEKYKIDEWPWNKEICLEISQKLEAKAKDGSPDLFQRLKTLYSWIGVEIEISNEERQYLSEANRVRNILLHRYGKVSEKDATECPELKEWIGEVMPLSRTKFDNYYNGMKSILVSIMFGIGKREVKI